MDSLAPLSVIVRVTVYVPAELYVCETLAPVPLFVSPKSQTYDTMPPSGSEDPEASKLTVMGAWPVT